jgi:hypothetical protein
MEENFTCETRGPAFESSLTTPKLWDTRKIGTRDHYDFVVASWHQLFYDISYRVTSLDDFSEDDELSTIMTINF